MELSDCLGPDVDGRLNQSDRNDRCIKDIPSGVWAKPELVATKGHPFQDHLPGFELKTPFIKKKKKKKKKTPSPSRARRPEPAKASQPPA